MSDVSSGDWLFVAGLMMVMILGRYPQKRLTAPYLESSVAANTYSQGKTPDCRLFPPWELAFGDTYLLGC